MMDDDDSGGSGNCVGDGVDENSDDGNDDCEFRDNYF